MDYKFLPTNRLIWSISFLLMIILLAGCSDEKPYEITKSESNVTELDDRLQLEFEYEISNHSDEDYYFSLVFPYYIQRSLITDYGIVRLPANTSTTGVAVISVKNSGAELTEETVELIKNGKLPFVEQILIGNTISLNP
ncbi:hypothetical protein DYI25_05085 [Mesobacillus boroniphilus]|uniref:Lipoprotein n=1 Tax=Mesobacillus boroniphilus TaxID=308892 RepID=A0A944GWM1_9BACI|nr:hypothetical protein [Mesobacillus boroniphilus]MBS8263815.1 hypothetical protein [Mesobacillus boroniphilus]